MFIPFYHIVLLSNNRNNVITSSFVIDKKIEKKISHIINQFGYNKFPEELLSCKIPDLIILDKFNYGSAFFTDNYRMSEHKPLR